MSEISINYSKTKYSITTDLDNLTDEKLLTGTINVYGFDEEIQERFLIRIEKYKNGHPIYIENRTFKGNEEIETSYTYDFLCPCTPIDTAFSYQVTKNGKEYCFYKGNYGWDTYPVNSIGCDPVNYIYPYFKNTPPLIGFVGGYNFLQNNQIEVGVMISVIESNLKTGAMGGYILSYARPLDRNLNTINLEMGLYSPLTLGIGINSNFDDKNNHILGFKVFGEVTFYHTQLIYAYNMFSDKKNAVLDLNHHALKLRVTLNRLIKLLLLKSVVT